MLRMEHSVFLDAFYAMARTSRVSMLHVDNSSQEPRSFAHCLTELNLIICNCWQYLRTHSFYVICEALVQFILA